MSQEKIRFKIVNKAKDGITLSARKGSKPEKMSWDEFNRYYTIEDKVWAVPSEELIKKFEEVDEHINNATVSFVLSGGLKGDGVPKTPDQMTHMLVMGEEIRKITELIGCSLLEATQMVRTRVDIIRNGDMFAGNRRPKRERRFEEKETGNEVLDSPRHSGKTSSDVEMHNNAILEDNPALLALKEKMAKEEK